jgi:hypothetical protein
MMPEFAATPGTFYYADGYLERLSQTGSDGKRRVTMGVSTPLEQDYDYFVAKFGDENAQYLLEVMGKWQTVA